MGKDTMSRTAYERAKSKYVPGDGPATKRAEQKARETGKLDPLVDPAGYGVIRRSLPRFEQQENGLWLMTVGTPIPIETRGDTTASMGNNVDIVIDVMPKAFELYFELLPGCDPQVANGIFGDRCDSFILCRPQFEMEAEKILNQLTLMVPDRDGGDVPEDPHYGLFAGAYLTSAYLHWIGLKGYDFTVSDAPARDLLDESQLIRVFGKDVFDKAKENGHLIDRNNLPTTAEVVQDMLKISHGFFLQVDNYKETTRFWTKIFGKNRVIALPDTRLLPQVQGTIIGLTEGTLALGQVEEFLLRHNVDKDDAKTILRSVANIPIGAQAALPNYGKRPKAGDLFRNKTDLWPLDPSEIAEIASKNEEKGKRHKGIKWI